MITQHNNFVLAQKIKKKEQGVTLITVLLFLMIMTVVGVSASRIAIIDILIAGNDQQQMLVHQQTESDLKVLTTVVKLYEPLVGKLFSETTGAYTFDTNSDKPYTVEKITDRHLTYSCIGFAGNAISIGPNVPSCDLYDFQINSSLQNSNVKDRRNRGAGKEKPNPQKNSYL